MNPSHFDTLARVLASAAPRRAVTGAVAGGVLAALLSRSMAVENAAGKKRKKKRKKRLLPGCAPSCANKACGQDDGCGAPCTVPQGCGAGEACRNGTCVPSACTPPCTGNEICDNGACVCPPGMKRCEGPGLLVPCHECCPNPGGICLTCPHEDCVGNPNGQHCWFEDSQSQVATCHCLGLKNCGGLCGYCCDNADCLREFGVGSFCAGDRACACEQGLTYCGTEVGCRDIENDRDACGQNCKLCPPGFGCFNGACCTNDCGTRIIPGQPCCVGTCAIAGGAPSEPTFGCVQ